MLPPSPSLSDYLIILLFSYSLLSVLSEKQWVAARTVQLLEEKGFDNDWLYETVSIKGGSAMKEELINSVKSGIIDVGNDKLSRNQVIYVIGLIIQYFTSEEEDDEEGDDDDDKVDDLNGIHRATTVEKGLTTSTNRGVGALLDKIVSSKPPPPPSTAPPGDENAADDEKINHWSMLADNIQASNLNTFDELENYLSKDLLRLTSVNAEDAAELLQLDGRATKDAFSVSRHMIMCWVNAGYNFHQLRNIVNNKSAEEILPPRDPNDNSKFFLVQQNKASNKNNTKRILAFQFLGQFKTMNKNMNERQIDYAVYKSLLFVMR